MEQTTHRPVLGAKVPFKGPFIIIMILSGERGPVFLSNLSYRYRQAYPAPPKKFLAISSFNGSKDISLVVKCEGDKYVFNGKKIHLGPLPVTEAHLYYTVGDSLPYIRINMLKKEKEFKAVIPGSKVKDGEIKYYIKISDMSNASFCPKLADKKPFIIKIK